MKNEIKNQLPTEKDPVGKEVNYMSVGRTIKCGHCEPDKYGEGLRQAERVFENYKCNCKCHDSENVQSWGEIDKKLKKLGFGGLARITLKQFISNEIQRAVESERAEIIKKLHKVAMYHHEGIPCYAVKDVLDLLKNNLPDQAS